MKKFAAILLSAVMALSLAACSNMAPAAENTATGVEAIKQAGKLVMMTNASFPPYEYMGEGGKIAGVDVDLAQMVADELGVELEIIDMNFDLLTSALASQKGDLVAAGMSITEERQQSVDFSIPYVDATLLIIVPEGSDIKGADDLVGLTISVQENTTSDLYVTDNVEGAKLLRFKSAVDAGTAVLSGKADVAVIDEMTAKNIVNANPGLQLLETPLAEEQYAMAVAKGNQGLLDVVNKVLEQAVADGTVDKLTAQHMEVTQNG